MDAVTDHDSIHSVEGSITDSGRGPSEEGEGGHVKHCRYLPPPPPPPRGAYWLQPQAPRTQAHGSHPTVRFQGLTTTPEEGADLGGDPSGASEKVSSPNRTPYVGPQPNTCIGVNPWTPSGSDSRPAGQSSLTIGRTNAEERLIGRSNADNNSLARRQSNGSCASGRGNRTKPVIIGPNVIV